MLFNKLKRTLLSLLVVIGALSIYLAILAYTKNEEIRSEISFIMKKEAVLFYKIDNFISKIENTINDMGVLIGENFISSDPTSSQNFEIFISETDKYIKAIMSQDNGFQGAWFVMNPDLQIQRKGGSVMLRDYTLTSWYYLGNDGKIIKGPRNNKRLTPKEDPYYFETISEGKETITNVYTDTDNNTQMISIAKPVYNNEQLLGVVGVDINLANLKEFFRKIENKSDLKIYLFDSMGNFIIGTKKPSKLLSDYALTVMNDNHDNILRASLINDNWVFIENQASKSPYLACEISLKKINNGLKFILHSLYIVCALFVLCLIVILVISNIMMPSAIEYKPFGQ